MPQAMNLERELVSFFRQSRRRSWTKDQIIEVIHRAYIKQLEKAVEAPWHPPNQVKIVPGEIGLALSCTHCEKPIYRITGAGSPAFFHVETKEHYCVQGGTSYAEPACGVNSTTFTCKHCGKTIYSTAQGEPFPFLHILNDEYWCGENKTTNAEPLEETPKG